MERFFRQSFWTVQLAFTGLVALLAAKTVNLFVESAVAPAPSGTVRRAGPVAAPEVLAALDPARLSKLTGVALPAEPTDASEPRADLSSEPVKSSLRVKLLGTLLAAHPEWSLASVLDVGNQKSLTVMTGDALQSATVLEIQRDRVILLNGGRREFINGEAGDGAAPPPVATTTRVTEPPNAANTYGATIKALDENNYEVPRAELDKAVNNLNDLAMQARIVPAFKDGQPEGFKLFSIRPDSLYSKIGIQNGDVIRRINGFEMNSPEKALEIYTKLKEASRIDIEVDRNGSIVRKTYNVR